jgi:hypothetical protein
MQSTPIRGLNMQDTPDPKTYVGYPPTIWRGIFCVFNVATVTFCTTSKKSASNHPPSPERAINEARQRPLTPWGLSRFQKGDFSAGRNDVWIEEIARGTGTVTQRDGSRFQVDLEARTCSCKRFQDTDIPCGYAISVIYTCGRAPAEYFPA